MLLYTHALLCTNENSQDSTATTYIVACANSAAATSAAVSAVGTAVPSGIDPNSFDNSDCGFPSAFTVVEGPSTVHYSLGVESIAFESISCALSGTTYAVCTASAFADTSTIAAAASVTDVALNSNEVNSIMTTTTLTGSDAANGYLPVVVTAGAANAKPASGVSAATTGSATAKSTGTATSKGLTSSMSSVGATPQTSNAAVGGAPVVGAGILGAFGVAVAGALL